MLFMQFVSEACVFQACFHVAYAAILLYKIIFSFHCIHYVACDVREKYWKYLGKGQLFKSMKYSVWRLV